MYFHLSELVLLQSITAYTRDNGLFMAEKRKKDAKSCDLVEFSSYNLMVFKHLRKQI